MNIHHEPLFDTQKICEHYTEKDGVPVTYVCTTDEPITGRKVRRWTTTLFTLFW